MADEPSLSSPWPPTKSWQGNSAVTVAGATPDQIWPFLADFCGLDKWVPSLQVCRLVEGIPGQPGAIRYCATTLNAPDGTETTKWAKERLLAIDPVGKFLSYEVTENNVGLKSYVATLRVVSVEGGGCGFEWGFICDPAEGWTEEELKSFIEYRVQHMGKKMEDTLARAA